MPCGKKPTVKLWDKPKNLRVVTPSRYQKNEASVKIHWKNVLKDLESYYKDEQFWKSQSQAVRELVGPVMFERMVKIFNLQIEKEPYIPASEPSVITPSEEFYTTRSAVRMSIESTRSTMLSRSVAMYSEVEEGEEGEEGEEEEDEPTSRWTSSIASQAGSSSPIIGIRRKSEPEITTSSKISKLTLAKSVSKILSRVGTKSFHKSFSRNFSSEKDHHDDQTPSDVSAHSEDDLLVHVKSIVQRYKKLKNKVYNPHFEMLYCCEEEEDMIKWASKYKQKVFVVSASDECSKKAEILTKQLAHDFYEWWISVGSADYKSEIKCPSDLESLFQIWFDEHASRGLVLDPKIMPCVLQSIADYCLVPQLSCQKALGRQIAWDIQAETSPAHTMAFDSALPLKMKHIPPKNFTAQSWHPVVIPEDLKSMETVWGEIAHLTSTKSFTEYLKVHPHLPMPPILKELSKSGDDKKQPFVVPSDIMLRTKSQEDMSTLELNFPVSRLNLEIKDVLSKLLSD